ncbi:MAG TPA: lysylphosphatidylglycerol synthase transmembrane domain-containing protein [Jatrophihabitans sp.]|nr:lysylphosphatidylglycerol synthase transmembrane domain-containing protein [Jatrophihabitans sp.]
MALPTAVRCHPVRWLLALAALIGAGVLLTPKVSQAASDMPDLRGASLGWLLVALAAQIASLVAFSIATYALIERGCRPAFTRTFRIDLVTVALSHAVPAGSVAGTALGTSLLIDEGVDEIDAGFVKVSQTLLSATLLQAMLGAFLVLRIIVASPSGGNIAVASAGAVVIAGVGCFVWLLAKNRGVISKIAVATVGRVPKVPADKVERVVGELSDRLIALLRQPRQLLTAAAASLGNWVFDLISLWAALRAFGPTPSWTFIGVAFGVAQVAASLPISPAGLGVVESSLVPLLISGGASQSVSVLGVLAWRLWNFWLPIPVGAVAYLLILHERHSRRSNQAEGRRHRMIEDSWPSGG